MDTLDLLKNVSESLEKLKDSNFNDSQIHSLIQRIEEKKIATIDRQKDVVTRRVDLLKKIASEISMIGIIAHVVNPSSDPIEKEIQEDVINNTIDELNREIDKLINRGAYEN